PRAARATSGSTEPPISWRVPSRESTAGWCARSEPHPMIMRSAFLRPQDVPRIERGEDLGYTPGWDLITAVDQAGRSVARVVSFAPDRALVVFDARDPPQWFQGELVFPSESGLGPVRAQQIGPASR